jgi:hypothetical protein
MHISNDRYFDDRQRHDLALRMIRHEARTCTIRSCTGLTDDRIRRLYQTFAAHMPAVRMRRHRGKSPRQIAYFTRNSRVQFDASLLAGLFAAFGLLDAATPAHDATEYGGLLCDAYETHIQLVPSSSLSFEHGWFLLQLLRRKTALGTLRCRQCEGHFLYDRSTVVLRPCPACQIKHQPVGECGRRRMRKGPRRSTLTRVKDMSLPPPRLSTARLGT